MTRETNLLTGWRYRVLVGTVVVSVVGYLLFSIWGGWNDVVAAATRIGTFGLLVALGLSLVNYIFRFFRWQRYLRVLGHEVPWMQSLRIYIAGFALTTTPGKAGEAFRGVFLKPFGVPYRNCVGALISERFSDLIAVALLTAVGLWSYKPGKPLIFTIFAMIIAILMLIQSSRWLHAIKAKVWAILPHRFANIVTFFVDTVLSFKTCFNISNLFYGIALGLIAWLAEAVAFYYMLYLLGAEIDMTVAIFIYCFSVIVGAVSCLPGGLGTTEIAIFELLKVNDVATTTAIAVTVMIRLTTLWFSVILGLLALQVGGRSVGGNHRVTEL